MHELDDTEKDIETGVPAVSVLLDGVGAYVELQSNDWFAG